MKNIKNTDIYVGNMCDWEDVAGGNTWSAVHCCKRPYHAKMVGYGRGEINPRHPNYLYIAHGNEMALNLVDVGRFQPNYVESKYEMFMAAFDFIDEQLYRGNKVLIHCNEGLSRGPCLAVAYLGYHNIDGYGEMPFHIALNRFSSENCYPVNPKEDIYRATYLLWDRIVGGKAHESRRLVR